MTVHPSSLPPARLLVFEKTGRWARALCRALPELSPRMRQLRSLDACQQEMIGAEASFVALECGVGNWEAVWAMVLRLRDRYCHVQTAVFLEPSLQPVANVFREAGALEVAATGQEVLRVARLAALHFRAFPAGQASRREELLSRLPWGDDAE